MGIFGKSKKDKANDLMKEGVTAFNKIDYNWASYKFSEVLKLDPKNRTALLYKARTLGNVGKYEEADQYFNKAIQIKPDSEAWLEKGKVQLKYLGYVEEALNSFNKAYELNPVDINITTSICDYYAKKGQYNEMRDIIDRYLTNYPNNASAWYTKGLFLERAGKKDEGYLCYQKAESLGSLEAKGILKTIQWEKKQNKAINQQFCFKESDVIGKYSADFIEQYQNAIDKSNNIQTKANIVVNRYAIEDIIRNSRFPAPSPRIQPATIIVSQNNLSIVGKHTYSISLDKIILITPIQDEFNNENAFIIRFIDDANNPFIVRIPKDYEKFYTTISEAIRKTRERNSGVDKNVTIIDFSSIKEYLKNGGVMMQTFKCPGCGAALEFPESTDVTTCQFCGNKIKAVDVFEKIRALI